jgi:hypothetical protein
VTAKKKCDPIYAETISEAVKTGFLFGLSINHYENYTREELIKEGHSEARIDVADEVLRLTFGTSVGAKEKKCDPRLWTERPCADCNTTVNTQWEGVRGALGAYGVYLCKRCLQMRNSKRICSKCQEEYQDPAVNEKGTKFLVRKHEILDVYLCYWCELEKANRDRRQNIYRRFLTNRCALEKFEKRDEDIRDLMGKLEKMAGEKLDFGDYEPYFDEAFGVDYDKKKFKNLYITRAGFAYDRPNPEYWPDWGQWEVHPQDESKIVHICRFRIFHHDCRPYAEIVFNSRSLSRIDTEIENKRNASSTEIAKIWDVAQKWLHEEEKRGRPKEEYSQDQKAFDLLVEKARNLDYTGDLSLHRAARAVDRFGISATGKSCYGTKCAGCQAVIRLIERRQPGLGWKGFVHDFIRNS